MNSNVSYSNATRLFRRSALVLHHCSRSVCTPLSVLRKETLRLVALAVKCIHSLFLSVSLSSSRGDLRQMGRGGVTEILPGVKKKEEVETNN